MRRSNWQSKIRRCTKARCDVRARAGRLPILVAEPFAITGGTLARQSDHLWLGGCRKAVPQRCHHQARHQHRHEPSGHPSKSFSACPVLPAGSRSFAAMRSRCSESSPVSLLPFASPQCDAGLRFTAPAARRRSPGAAGRASRAASGRRSPVVDAASLQFWVDQADEILVGAWHVRGGDDEPVAGAARSPIAPWRPPHP